MSTTKLPAMGTKARRVYDHLRDNPGLTAREVSEALPDVISGTAAVAVSTMHHDGLLVRTGGSAQDGYRYRVAHPAVAEVDALIAERKAELDALIVERKAQIRQLVDARDVLAQALG